MNITTLQAFCNTLAGTTEDIKWKDNLCFSVGGKIYCIVDLEPPLRASFKVPAEEFPELTSVEGIIPAPYLAKYGWVKVVESDALPRREWERLVRLSHDIVEASLSSKSKTTKVSAASRSTHPTKRRSRS